MRRFVIMRNRRIVAMSPVLSAAILASIVLGVGFGLFTLSVYLSSSASSSYANQVGAAIMQQETRFTIEHVYIDKADNKTVDVYLYNSGKIEFTILLIEVDGQTLTVSDLDSSNQTLSIGEEKRIHFTLGSAVTAPVTIKVHVLASPLYKGSGDITTNRQWEVVETYLYKVG